MMFNKMGKTNRSSTKFETNILYITGSSCSKSSDNQFIFKKVTIKDRWTGWTQVGGPKIDCRQSLI